MIGGWTITLASVVTLVYIAAIVLLERHWRRSNMDCDDLNQSDDDYPRML